MVKQVSCSKNGFFKMTSDQEDAHTYLTKGTLPKKIVEKLDSKVLNAYESLGKFKQSQNPSADYSDYKCSFDSAETEPCHFT